MKTKSIIVFTVFGLLFLPALISWFRELRQARKFRAQPNRTVQFTESVQLKWGGHFWEGRTVLHSWAGFQERLGAYASESSSEPSIGEVQLTVESPDDSIPSSPSEAQVKGFCYMRDNEIAVQNQVLKAIFDVYPKWREDYRDFLGEDLDRQMPVLNTPADLKRLIGLSTVHILDDEKDGLAYVGFEFGCTWEEEHGLGVMTIGDRVVEVGSAEESFGVSSEENTSANG
jgi:hypothetical protein